MTRHEPHSSGPDDHRARIALAVLTGVVGGVARAVTSWLLDHVTSLLT